MMMSFHAQVIAVVPKLRAQAMALTRQQAAAEDLVQDAVCNALAASATFVPGTNFRAWMHRIVRNRFISTVRRRRDAVVLIDGAVPELSTGGAQEQRLALQELSAAMKRLPAVQLEALVFVAIHGLTYEQLADRVGCAVGTAKSRVFRARQQLHNWLVGSEDVALGRRKRPTYDLPIQYK
jgi:RNA polymerase sigma-70 factor (ECF subfamily)